MKFFWMIVLISSVLFVSCKAKEEEPPTIEWSQEKSSAFSKDLAIEENLDIRMFLDQRKHWKTIETGSGLRYFIYEKGSGPKAESGMLAEVRFKITQLNGNLCYATDSLETEIFKIDKSEIETGVQEGIKYMHVGDKAKLIIPSHLGHGLVGDFRKIPPLTTLVVDLELVSLRYR